MLQYEKKKKKEKRQPLCRHRLSKLFAGVEIASASLAVYFIDAPVTATFLSSRIFSKIASYIENWGIFRVFPPLSASTNPKTETFVLIHPATPPRYGIAKISELIFSPFYRMDTARFYIVMKLKKLPANPCPLPPFHFLKSFSRSVLFWGGTATVYIQDVPWNCCTICDFAQENIPNEGTFRSATVD